VRPEATPTDLSLAALMRGPWRGTPVTLALVAINVGVFALMLVRGAGLWHGSTEIQLAWGANFAPATQDGEWWRLLTAMFLHFGLVHLALNAWALWDAGRLVERLYGSLRFAGLYLGAGLTGNLVSLVVQGNRAVSGGASGAIFGVFGALLVCLARERRAIEAREFRWLFGGAAVFTAASLALGFLIPGIDNAAHLGGFVSGGLLGAALARSLDRERPVPLTARLAATAALLAATAAFALHLPEPRYRLSEEREARSAIRQFLVGERRIGERWKSIVGEHRGGASFEELAGEIDADVAREYQDSFEQLASVSVSPGAPSASELDYLRRYAQLRGDAAHALAEALRANDAPAIERALEAMRTAPQAARAASAAASVPAPPASAAAPGAHGSAVARTPGRHRR
jgi:rhomboid protease GluP